MLITWDGIKFRRELGPGSIYALSKDDVLLKARVGRGSHVQLATSDLGSMMELLKLLEKNGQA